MIDLLVVCLFLFAGVCALIMGLYISCFIDFIKDKHFLDCVLSLGVILCFLAFILVTWDRLFGGVL